MLGPQGAHSGLPFSKPIVLLYVLHTHRKSAREEKRREICEDKYRRNKSRGETDENKYYIGEREREREKYEIKKKDLRFAAGSRFLLALQREQDRETASKCSSRSHVRGSRYSSTSLFALGALADAEKKDAITNIEYQSRRLLRA